MSQIIIYNQDNGIPAVVMPTEEALQQHGIMAIAIKDVPSGKKFKIIDESDLPEDACFHDAWELCSTGDSRMITVNMDKARDIKKDMIRADRKAKLEALDVEFMRAVEAGDADKQAEIAAKKQALRDATDDPAIAAATTPDELKAVVPTALQGDEA